MKFKVGDRVVVLIDRAESAIVTAGDTGEVVRAFESFVENETTGAYEVLMDEPDRNDMRMQWSFYERSLASVAPSEAELAEAIASIMGTS